MQTPCEKKGRGMTGYWLQVSPEERAFYGMFARCYGRASPNYSRYGGRGIYVCARWTGPNGCDLFLADMGKRPSDEHSLDRIDNDGIYEPDNCRWATAKIQANNRKQRDWRRD